MRTGSFQYSTLNRSLLPALEKVGLHLVMEHEKLNEEQQEYVDRYFEDNVYRFLPLWQWILPDLSH